MKIIGAGLAGLIAGNVFQRATLLEAGPEAQLGHKAVLRFRSNAVGEATGIEFRPVTVHKGIWYDRRFVQPDIRYANWYSTKVIGRIADRSIWKTESVTRFVAPENLVEQLAERCAGRITWNQKADADCFGKEDVISTMPLPTLAELLLEYEAPKFNFAPITVRRWRINRCDAFQTIYFPDPHINLYRASITGSLLIAEYVTDKDGFLPAQEAIDAELFEAFGLQDAPTAIDKASQRFGKIAPLTDDTWRRQFILRATLQHRVYSLGRFATWRNILLDDVLKDTAVIKRLISGGAYAAARLC